MPSSPTWPSRTALLESLNKIDPQASGLYEQNADLLLTVANANSIRPFRRQNVFSREERAARAKAATLSSLSYTEYGPSWSKNKEPSDQIIQTVHLFCLNYSDMRDCLDGLIALHEQIREGITVPGELKSAPSVVTRVDVGMHPQFRSGFAHLMSTVLSIWRASRRLRVYDPLLAFQHEQRDRGLVVEDRAQVGQLPSIVVSDELPAYDASDVNEQHWSSSPGPILYARLA
jgi:hypothetical protein